MSTDSTKIFWTIVITGGLGGAWAAQAQSPFANKKTQNAWETAQPAPAPAPAPLQTPARASVPPAQSYVPPQQTYQQQTYPTWPQAAQSAGSSTYTPPSQPTYQAPPQHQSFTYQAPPIYLDPVIEQVHEGQAPASAYQPQPAYQPPSSSAPAPSYYQPQTSAPPASRSPFAPKTAPVYQNDPKAYQGQTYQGQTYQGQAQQPVYQPPQYQNQYYQGQQSEAPQAQNQYYQNQQNFAKAPAPKRSWKERLGFNNLATSLKGFLKVGAAAVRRESDVTGINEWDDGYIFDGQVRGEVSAITQSGLEYGVGGLVRGQYDEFRRGFGGLVGDCPAGVAGCATVDVNGTPTPVRGHTSRFFTDGESDAQEFEIALEGLYGFLRTSYGDVTVGRDDGAAYLFSLGAPSVVAVNASNSPVDYTGLDSVKTVNDASGFSEKITYVSPRLLGDRIGVGVQFGASYALNARACGVDFCVRDDDFDDTGALAPDLDDVIEFGLSLDRTFKNGISVEATGTYARASEQSSLAAFDDLSSFGAGLEVEWNDFTLGGSWLNSNNALDDGDYTAWDVGLSWKPAQWGASLSYGRATDDNIGLTSDQITLGGVYDINDRFSFGGGAQYVDRSVPVAIGGIVEDTSEEALGLFIEGKVTF